VLIEDLARGAADLLSVGNSGQMRSLNRLAELAVREVPACCGATAILWRDHELVGLASTHPDLAELTEFQLRTGSGPVMDAMREGEPSSCADTLRDSRWPEFASEALYRGVRCSVALVHEFPPMSVVLSLASVRPSAIHREQLRNAVESRAVVDQAKGILMHALGCTAADALQRMRRVSQTRHIKVTDVAKQVVEARGASPGR
jgi:hypothetical protein